MPIFDVAQNKKSIFGEEIILILTFVFNGRILFKTDCLHKKLSYLYPNLLLILFKFIDPNFLLILLKTNENYWP